MKVEIKPVISIDDVYKVFGDGEYIGNCNALCNNYWELHVWMRNGELVHRIFVSYDDMYEWLVWSDY